MISNLYKIISGRPGKNQSYFLIRLQDDIVCLISLISGRPEREKMII